MCRTRAGLSLGRSPRSENEGFSAVFACGGGDFYTATVESYLARSRTPNREGVRDMSESNANDAQGGGLHVDSDWKAEAQRMKQKLAEQRSKESAAGVGQASDPGAAAEAGQQGQQQQLPPANFQTMVSQTVTQAMFAMGMIPDPQTGQRYASLDMARHHIDMLGVLEEKTKGNLTDDEQKLLTQALYELRMQYVQLSQQVIQEQTGGGEQEGGGQSAGAGSGGIITG